MRARLLLSAVALAAAFAPEAASQAVSGVRMTEPGASNVSSRVVLPLNKSSVVELERPAADVVITNPEIADATVQTAQRIIFRGVTTGQTNAFIFDRSGAQILNLEIAVERDLRGLTDLIERHVPDARVGLEAVNDNVVLTGMVDNQSQQDQVMRLARAFIGAQNDDNLVNLMAIASEDQVLLRVRIVEMSRSVIKQLGLNFNGDIGFGELASQAFQPLLVTDALGNIVQAVDADGNPLESLQPAPPFNRSVGFGTGGAVTGSGAAAGGLSTTLGNTNFNGGVLQSDIGLSIDALESVGILRTLAEPNITAISGETANFLAGGEFPFPESIDDTGQVTVGFRPFGVGLGFTPVVLSEGRISLKLSTEVSELSDDSAVLDVPALSVRRAETTVEMPSGGSMMIAGLIQAKTQQAISGVPGAKSIPILGSLFRSRDFLNEETELVIIITPFLVNSASIDDFRTPADGYKNASDPKAILFGKLNKVYGRPGGEEAAEDFNAPIGFIEE